MDKEESIQEENYSQDDLEVSLGIGSIVRLSYEEEGELCDEEVCVIVYNKDDNQDYKESTPILSDSPLGIALLNTSCSTTGKEKIIQFIGGRGQQNTIKIHKIH